MIERKSASSSSNDKASTAKVVDNEKAAGRTSPEKQVRKEPLRYPVMSDKMKYGQQQGWKREAKTWLMVNKEGYQREMNRAERNFYKECDRIEEEKASRRKEKFEIRERKSRKYQERQKKQDDRREEYLASIKRTVKDRSGEAALASSPKRQKPAENSNEQEAGDDQTPEEKQAEERYWAQPEVKKLTIRILATTPGVTLSRQDIGHINKNHLRSVRASCKKEDGTMDIEFARKLNIERLGRSGRYIRAKMVSEEGIEWARELIPKIPPRIEGGHGYVFLEPGEKSHAFFKAFVENLDVSDRTASGREDLITDIWMSNPGLDGADYHCWFEDLDHKSQKCVIKVKIATSDLERLRAQQFRLNYGYERLVLIPDDYQRRPALDRGFIEGLALPSSATISSQEKPKGKPAATATSGALVEQPATADPAEADASMEEVIVEEPPAREAEVVETATMEDVFVDKFGENFESLYDAWSAQYMEPNATDPSIQRAGTDLVSSKDSKEQSEEEL